jgi:nicotinamide mononucleotide transporter
VASILSAKMFLENWYFWIVINLSYIVLYIYKEAYLTAVLYAILVALAVLGLREWKKQLHA